MATPIRGDAETRAKRETASHLKARRRREAAAGQIRPRVSSSLRAVDGQAGRRRAHEDQRTTPVRVLNASPVTRSHFSQMKVISSTEVSSALPSREKPAHLDGHVSNRL